MHSERDLIAELKIALIEYLRQLAQVLAVSQARQQGCARGEGGRGNIWTAPRRRLEARQCWANQRRTNAPELSRAAVSSDMHNARSVSPPLSTPRSSLSLSLSVQSPRSFTDNAAHTELLVLLSSAQRSSAQSGLGVLKFQQLGNISHAFLIANNEANGRSKRRQAGGGRKQREREFEERGGGKWSRQEMQQADCSTQLRCSG